MITAVTVVVIGGSSLVCVSYCVVILHDPFSSHVVIVFVVSVEVVLVFVVTVQTLSLSQIVVTLALGEDLIMVLLNFEEIDV